MLNPLTTIALLITIMVALVGQTMTYHFLGYEVATSEQHATVETKKVVHHGAVTNTAEVDDCCDLDCCETECICPANACTSMVYLELNSWTSELLILSEPILSLPIQNTNAIVTRRYRPPIFTS